MQEKEKLWKQIHDKPHKFGQWLGYSKLIELHSDWIHYCWKSEGDVVLMAHRNSYKTTSVLVVGAIWYLLFNPDNRILFLRKAYEGATSIVKEIRQHLESEKLQSLYLDLYGVKQIKTRNWRDDSLTLSTKRRVTKEGSIEALGIGGSITGRHYEKIMADDIVTMDDRISRAERERTKNFVRELKNIPVPGGTISYTGTPWHRDDAFSVLPPPARYPLNKTNLIDFTPDYIADLRRSTTGALFAANYELVHIADDTRIFPDPQYVKWPEEVRPVAWCDPAFIGTNTTALAMLGKYGGKVYVRGWVWRRDITEMYDTIINILNDYKNGTLHEEVNADQGASMKEFQTRYPAVLGHRESMNKHNKIVLFLKKNWHLLHFAEDCQPEFINQILDYQEGQEPDDAPDALAALIRETKVGDNSLERRFGVTA